MKKKFKLIATIGSLALAICMLTIGVLAATNVGLTILVASLVSSIIAGLTIFGKALGKRNALNNSTSIIFKVGKIISLFTKQQKNKKKDNIE